MTNDALVSAEDLVEQIMTALFAAPKDVQLVMRVCEGVSDDRRAFAVAFVDCDTGRAWSSAVTHASLGARRVEGVCVESVRSALEMLLAGGAKSWQERWARGWGAVAEAVAWCAP
jgi:hypothetical protein